MSWGIIILLTFLFSFLVDKIVTTKNEAIYTNNIKQSIEDAWRATDMTTVPADMLLAYRRYLKSEPWYALRRAALKRDSHRCVRCGYIGNLQVHHTSYEGIYENFNFSIDQLESVCGDGEHSCHSRIHRGELPMKKE